MSDESSDATSQNETRSGTIVEAATTNEASSKARMEEILRLTATDDTPDSEEVRRTRDTRLDSNESSSVLNSSQPVMVVPDNDEEESSSSCRRLTNENEGTQTTVNQNTCSKSSSSSNVSTTAESTAVATSTSSSKERIQLILRLTAPQPSSSTREVESTPGAQQQQSTNNQEEGQPPDNRTAGRRRPFPSPPQQPGAVPIAGPDARTDGQHDHGTIVIGGTTVVASSSHSASQMMEPIPALLVPETTTNHNHSSLQVELVHATTIPTKMSRRTILAALFALLLVAGCAIGLALHFGKNRPTAQPKTQPEQQFTTWVQVGDEDESARIVGTRPMDQLGSSVAISGDGRLLVAGAPWAGSSFSFVSTYSIHEDSLEPLADSTTIVKQNVDEFGAGLSLSWDGTVLAVGSVPGVFVYRLLDHGNSNGSIWEEYGVPIEIRGALSIQVSANGLKLVVGGSGSVQAFGYSDDDGGSWSEYGQALQSSNNDTMDLFGWSVALSANGDHLAIGIPGRDSIYGESTGGVQVFTWNGTAQSWRQSGNEATIDGIGQYDAFGFSVALSADGSCVAIGAIQNTAFSLGIPNSLRPGYVRVYCYGEGGDWKRRGETLVGERDSFFGYSIDLSSDGRTVAVGAPLANAEAGQVHIFRYQDDRGWVPLATFDGDPESSERCGTSVSMSSNGDVVAVGCPFRDVQGTGEMEDLSWAGSVRVYREVPCEEEDFALCRRQGRRAFVDLSDPGFGPRHRWRF